MELKEQILILFCGRLKRALERADPDFEEVTEIRLRAGNPLILIANDKEIFLAEDGRRVTERSRALQPSLKEIRETLEAVCGYSGYAFEEEISRGYVTVSGGHRIGITGRAVIRDGCVLTLKYISGLNIRIAHPVTGCAEKWKAYFYQKGRPCHVLIISPPGCGKTTLLRDAVRMYSDGSAGYPGVSVGVVDERSEIAGSCRGIPSMELGMRTDILDGCPKREGMEMLLRSMSPSVIAADELGNEDIPAIGRALRCGCRILATVHAEDAEEFLGKPDFRRLADERVFERYFFLGPAAVCPDRVRAVYDKNFEVLWEETRCI